MPDDFLARSADMLLGRWDGPMSFRLLVQPLVAALLAVRAGARDAREGRAPFLWELLVLRQRRAELLREAAKDIGRVFVVAIVLDVAYELLVHRWVYPLQAVIVATVLAIVPYVLLRGPVTRLLRRRMG